MDMKKMEGRKKILHNGYRRESEEEEEEVS